MSSSTSTLAYDIIARDRASGTFSKIGRALGALGVGLSAAGLLKFAKDSVQVEAAFSQTMASVQVNAGVGQRALGALSDMAIQLGQDTVYSANEAAQAMLELSKGGMTAAQIKAGALKETLALAATESIDLGQSATIVARTLKTFGLQASQAHKVVDLLAAGSVASTSDVEGLAAGLKYVGSTARSSKIPLADTVTALAALNNAGLDASTAGTSLNRMLLGLSLSTTKASETAGDLGLSFTDAKGDLLPMVEVVKRLHETFDDMSTSQRNNDLKKIFGVEGMRAANILLSEGARGWRKLSGEVTKAGVAQKMADARMSGTAGSLERLSGSIETAQLKLGKALAPAVQAVADGLADNLGPAMDGAIDLGGDLVDALEPLGDVLKVAGKGAAQLGGLLGDLPDPIKTIAIEAGIAALALPRLSGAVTSASSAMRNGYTYARVYALELQDVSTRSGAVASGLSKLGGAARAAAGVGGMIALAEGAQQSNRALGTLETTLGGAATGFAVGGPWGALIGGAAGAAMGVFAHRTDRAAGAAKAAQPDLQGLAASLDQVTGATKAATRAEIYDDLWKSGAVKTLTAYGVSARTAVDAVLGHKDALTAVSRAQRLANSEMERNSATIRENDAEIATLTSSYRDISQADHDRVEALKAENKALSKRNGEIKAGIGAIGSETSALKKAQKETWDKTRATASLNDILRRLPKSVRTEIKENAPEAKADIYKLQQQYDLTPKQIQTVLKQLGVEKSIADLKRLLAQQDRLHNKDIWITTHYKTVRDSGGGQAQGGDGIGPSSSGSGGSSGGGGGGADRRATTAGRGASRVERNPLAGLELRVVGVDPGQKAYLRTGSGY